MVKHYLEAGTELGESLVQLSSNVSAEPCGKQQGIYASLDIMELEARYTSGVHKGGLPTPVCFITRYTQI